VLGHPVCLLMKPITVSPPSRCQPALIVPSSYLPLITSPLIPRYIIINHSRNKLVCNILLSKPRYVHQHWHDAYCFTRRSSSRQVIFIVSSSIGKILTRPRITASPFSSRQDRGDPNFYCSFGPRVSRHRQRQDRRKRLSWEIAHCCSDPSEAPMALQAPTGCSRSRCQSLITCPYKVAVSPGIMSEQSLP
jgi:hypothetical protein